MRSRTIYRDKEGKVIRIPCNQVAPYRGGETTEDFSTRMIKTLYQLECKEGARFRIPGYSHSTLKKVWNSAITREKAGAT